MKILDWIIGKKKAEVDRNNFPVLGGETISVSREKVTHDVSLRLSAVWACVNVLSQALASLPLKVYRRIGDNEKEEAKDHWLYSILHYRPNLWQTPFDFKEMMQGHLSLRGNAYGWINWRDNTITPLHPDRVTPERAKDGSIIYKVRRPEDNYQERKLLQVEVLHLRGLSSDGLLGVSPIMTHSDAVGGAIATQKFTSAFYGNGTNVGNLLTHPGSLSKEAQSRLKEQLRNEYSGAGNAFKTLVLEEDMKWQSLGVKPEEAQFLETRKFQVNDIARIFRVPPHMIGDLDRATFSNIEQQSIDFVTYSLLPWIVKWEEAINLSLLYDDPDYFVKFVVDALLRGETKTRYEAYGKAIQDGWMTRNEVRAKEDMNPLDGLDDILTPLNMQQGMKNNEETLATLLLDCSDRIASKESREIGEEVTAAFKDKHRKYITQTLSPIAKAFGRSINALRTGQYIARLKTGISNEERIYKTRCMVFDALAIPENRWGHYFDGLGDHAGEDAADSCGIGSKD